MSFHPIIPDPDKIHMNFQRGEPCEIASHHSASVVNFTGQALLNSSKATPAWQDLTG